MLSIIIDCYRKRLLSSYKLIIDTMLSVWFNFKFNLKFKKNSFTCSLTKLWNSLPSQVRLSSDADDFRSKLNDCSFLERIL